MVRVADLVLEKRSALHLLEIGKRRVVLATDASGLKAMTLLKESFAGALSETDQPAQTPRLADDLSQRRFHLVGDADRARVRLEAALGNNQAG